ncbi:NADPH-dependent curcumin reductase CurA [Erythrobacter litoralis]|jgi:NADPH-dependent curcumin reductase CurA|uniref:Alcohol dehydrogenase n=1 Tax=Erythrobacter litoralis TaxID=39960 RepID=A0A074MD05_9SPHN|nr:NADP-dependent oxidoreductase [Erythrobacter litoralis]AOL22138.1 NADPH-dependent curcumin reductase CurA [Erythrobacter litoralis]KEO90610.1 alcohol dehydrogenase [Erythrobacter litoralis]MEE4339927.1 NADP-dependent oxidoreductase [Erythrobacter sp.]
MENRFWRIERRPEGTDFDEALALVSAPLPDLAQGEIRIRNAMLSMDAGTRLWLTSREDGYQPPLPVGAPMTGLVLGEVIESRAEGFAAGDLVRAFGVWGEVSQVDAAMAGAVKLDPSVEDRRAWFGPLGMNGWTALWGIERTGAAKSGERVLVSAAAGATGILAVQIAKLLGCEAWGIAGGAEKCRFLTDELGIAGAVDYKAGDLGAQLDAAGGFDVYFDNVGGAVLDTVLTRMNHYGRIAVCGLLADYNSGERTAPREFDQVLMRRLRVEGFFSPDFMHEGEALTARLREWTETGELVMPYDVTRGLDNTLAAYRKLFTGGNIGKVIVELEP